MSEIYNADRARALGRTAMHDASSGDVPKAGTVIEGIYQRIARLTDNQQRLLNATQTVADRAIGERPPQPSQGAKPAEVRTGAFGAMQDALDHLEALQMVTAEQIDRLGAAI